MALIDDLKKKTEDGLKTLKETAQEFAFNVEKQAKIGKRKYVDITKLQRNIQTLFAQIGEYVYEEATSGRSVARDDPYLSERIGRISAMKSEIDALEDEITEIQLTLPPKKEGE
jgi:hypothetical protein